MSSPQGKTDRELYERVNGKKHGNLSTRMSEHQFSAIESVLPCPHDPNTLSELFLEGKSKLVMEAEAAKRSKHLLILNP